MAEHETWVAVSIDGLKDDPVREFNIFDNACVPVFYMSNFGISGTSVHVKPRHARLITAAPDLLAALIAVEKEISSRFASDLDMSDELRAVMIQARVAIAKTEPSALEVLAEVTANGK